MSQLSPQARWYLHGLQKDFSCTEESTEHTAMKELLDAELVTLNRGYIAGTKYYTVSQKGLDRVCYPLLGKVEYKV